MTEQFNEFLESVDPKHRAFVQELHEMFLGTGTKVTIEKKAAGFLVVYKSAKTKKSVFNIYFRKNGLHVRLYPAASSNKVTLTDYMVSEIDKAVDCKRLKGGECSDKCVTGYDFELCGKHYKKCRLCCFAFLVTEESKPVIETWVKEELVELL
ncbi:MAG: hypothetical protein FWH03_05630 [Firmicutes bacterium]|nr:hypothetical protein [Bacillota bacterium]